MYTWKSKGEECLFIHKMHVWGKGENEVGEGGGGKKPCILSDAPTTDHSIRPRNDTGANC